MAGYRERVTGDLDRWIAAGLVDPASRGAILATLPVAGSPDDDSRARRTVDAVTALIWIAAVLLGLAVVAFVAANWEGIGRLTRFGLLIGAFLVAALGGAEASRRGRAMISDVALTVASLVFASAIGLTGQVFELTGNPPAVPYGAGAAALALGAAGASRGALSVGVIAVLIGDFLVVDGALPAPVSVIAAPVVLVVAMRWGSSLPVHVASVGVLGALLWFAIHYDLQGWPLLGIAVVPAGATVALTRLPTGGDGHPRRSVAGIAASWFAVGALGFFIAAGYTGGIDDHTALGLVHRIVWIALSAGLIAFGRFARRGFLTGLGVLSLIAAACALLSDLGLDLLLISVVFLGCSFAALVVGLVLRRRRAGRLEPPTTGEAR